MGVLAGVGVGDVFEELSCRLSRLALTVMLLLRICDEGSREVYPLSTSIVWRSVII